MAERKDDEGDWDNGDCWNCGGEGYVYGCSWDWQCDTWDGDSCMCSRRCDVCNPTPPNRELQQALSEALEARDGQ